MSLLGNTNFVFIIIFFSLLRFIDADLVVVGSLFTITSLILIYFNLKKLNKKTLLLILSFCLFFLFVNEKREIIETNSVFKVTENHKNFFEEFLGAQKYKILEQKYSDEYPECIKDVLICFQNDNLNNKKVISPDQIPLLSNQNYSRKVSSINFKNLSDLRASFVNTIDGRINPHFFHKFETPYIVEYENLNSISKICFKGFVIITYKSGDIEIYDDKDYHCLDNDSNLTEILDLILRQMNSQSKLK